MVPLVICSIICKIQIEGGSVGIVPSVVVERHHYVLAFFLTLSHPTLIFSTQSSLDCPVLQDGISHWCSEVVKA